MLRANAAYRALWAARGVSVLGDAMSLVALLLLVAEGTGQALAVAALLLVGDFAPALLAPVTGTVSDRFDRRRVMIATDLAQAVVMGAIALLLPPLPVLLALVALRAVAAQIFLPTSRAILPTLIADRDLERGNALLGLGSNAFEVAGPALAAVLFPYAGIRGVLAFDAVTFLVSAVLLTRLPPTGTAGDRVEAESWWVAARGGVRHLGSIPVVRILLLGFLGVVACNGVDDVALVFLGTQTLAAGESGVGLLFTAIAAGVLAGYLALARSRRLPGGRSAAGAEEVAPGTPVPATLPALLLAGFVLSSAGNLLTGFAWAIGAAIGLQGLRGVGLAMMDLGATTLLQREVRADMLGRAFANFYGGIAIAAALSYVGGSVLLQLTDPRLTLWAAGAGGLAVALATALAYARSGRAGE